VRSVGIATAFAGLLIGSGCGTTGANDFDGDGTVDDMDCNPDDPAIHLGAEEDCHDGIDNDCDGAVDVDDAECVDLDGDGYTNDVDCDPEDPGLHPGADEVCDDGIDNDCDG